MKRRLRALRRFLIHLTPEWRRCVRIAANLSTTHICDVHGTECGLTFTPGQVMTMRRVSPHWGEDWL